MTPPESPGAAASPWRRIHVVGTSGTGKTTLAATLARRLQLPHVELDMLSWEPGWREADQDVFEQRVRAALAGDDWVVDGNYSRVRNLIWARAEQVIWLDYPLPLILRQLTRRTVHRVRSQELVCNGNREQLRMQFSRDSLFLWVVQTYARRRRNYPRLFAQPEFAHLKVHRFRSPRETSEWLSRAPVFEEAIAAGRLPDRAEQFR